MPNKQDYKLMLQKVLDTINHNGTDYTIVPDSGKIFGEAESMIKNDPPIYNWVIEYDGDMRKFLSEKELLEFVKDSFDEDPNFVSQVERVYKVEVDEDDQELENQIELGLYWSVKLDNLI